jgi:hypothetical protein
MTLAEIQEILDDARVSVSHMGVSSRRARANPVKKWSVTLVPAEWTKSCRWLPGTHWRGIGASLELAFDDALNKLAATAVKELG